MRQRIWTTITFLCGFLAATQFSAAQELTPEQVARILQRFLRRIAMVMVNFPPRKSNRYASYLSGHGRSGR